jgi:hypothetical protein
VAASVSVSPRYWPIKVPPLETHGTAPLLASWFKTTRRIPGGGKRLSNLVGSNHHPEAKMLKTLMLSTTICGLMMTGAMAQQSDAGGTSSSPSATSSASTSGGAKFISAQSPNQWVFSKFKGTDVLGPDNAKIGDVDDVLFERDGKVLALVVGVGGFLGVGQKNVAIEMSAFQVVPGNTGSNSASGSGGGSGSGNTTSAASSSNDPTNVKLKVSWTKDQLKEAPDFQYYKSSTSTSSSGSGSTSGQRGGGTAAPGGSSGGMSPPSSGGSQPPAQRQ